MSKLTRRQLITAGAVTVAGAGGLAVAAKIARRYGLVPPDSGGVYGPGATLTYAAQRLFGIKAPRLDIVELAHELKCHFEEVQRRRNSAVQHLRNEGVVEKISNIVSCVQAPASMG